MTTSTSAPSWLMLERYALGELSEHERRAVEVAVANDAATRACLDQIRADRRSMPSLPPLVSTSRPRAWFAFWGAWVAASSVVAVAALLFVNRPPELPASSAPTGGTKGDSFSISLVREQDGLIAIDPSAFDTRDRFKVRVTCARDEPTAVDVVVYQDGEASFPLDAQQIVCGNHVVLVGAFRFDRASVTELCAVLSPKGPVSRSELVHARPTGPLARCKTLKPAP